MADFSAGDSSANALDERIGSAGAARRDTLRYLSDGDPEKQATLAGRSEAELSDMAALKRGYDGLTESAKAIVRADLARAGQPSALGDSLGTMLSSLSDPQTLRDLYFLQVQSRANASDVVAGIGDVAKPAAQFLADLHTLQDHIDPDTGAVTQDDAYRAARDRLSQQASALTAGSKEAAASIGQFLADLRTMDDHVDRDTGTVSDDAAYRTARERLSRDAGALATVPTFALSAVTTTIANAVDTCALGGNESARACGTAATILGTGVGLMVTPAALSARFAAAGVKLETAVDAGISWGKGIAAQGYPWEDFIAAQLPADARLPAKFPTIDFFDDATGRAISAKTLDTTTASRIARPEQIYNTLKGYVDKLIDFKEVLALRLAGECAPHHRRGVRLDQAERDRAREHLRDPLSGAVRHIDRTTALDRPQHLEHQRRCHRRDRQSADYRENVVDEVVERVARVSRGPHRQLTAMPVARDPLEGRLRRSGLGGDTLALADRRVDALPQCACGILAQLSCLGQSDRGVGAEHEHLLLAGDTVLPAPRTIAARQDVEVEAKGIAELVRGRARRRSAARQIRQHPGPRPSQTVPPSYPLERRGR